MMRDLLAALCLVLVLEGLALFGLPRLWKSLAEQVRDVPERQLRIAGAVIAGLGLLCLQFVR
jgi:uncharacterized protein YjeT (DUF2065 family)